jgi:alpha-1,2-mannosyltransferase
VTTQEAGPRSWVVSASTWLTPRRIRAHAIVLAVCLWGVCAADFLTPGSFDRAANIKFQDFLSFYISVRLIHQGRTAELYDDQARTAAMLAIVHPIDVARESVFPPTAHSPTNVRLPNLYGPQVALLFVPLTYFPFLIAAQIWVVLNLLLYGFCVYVIWKSCPGLRLHGPLVALCALAFPPLFHVFVRGQTSVLVLACFTAAFLAFRADRSWLAGIALGFLAFKPQFLVAIPLVLLLSHAWKTLGGVVVAAGAQLAFTRIYFGPAVMHAYFDTLWHVSRVIDAAELNLAPIQMHSLRSFWTLLIPWPEVALALYVLSSVALIAVAAVVWKSSAPLALRFSALTLAAVLFNPHLFVYDLLALVPALLLLADWALIHAEHPSTPALRVLLYLAFVLPLLGPLSRWTHVQLSVPVFAALLCFLWQTSKTPSHKLASNESAVV